MVHIIYKLLQLLVTFHVVVCSLLFRQDVDYKNTFCSDIFYDKGFTRSNRMCAAVCGKEPTCLAFFYGDMGNCYVIRQPLTSSAGCVYRKGNLYKSEIMFMTTTAAVTTTTTAHVTSTTSPVYTCDEGWSEFQGSCYFLTGQTLSIVNADVCGTECKSHGAHVVHVESEEENQFIADLSYTSRLGGYIFFLGITDCEGPKFSYKLYGTTQTAPYINFMSGEGTDTAPSVCCVTLDGRTQQQWTDFYCSTSYSHMKAICEKEL